MKSFEIKVITTLGSTYENTIIAESQEEALEKAEKKYTMHKEILFEGEREATENEITNQSRPPAKGMSVLRVERMRKEQYAEGRSIMIRGAGIGVLGLCATIAAWIAGWIVSWTLLGVGYGLIDFFRGYSMRKNNKPESEDFQNFRNQ